MNLRPARQSPTRAALRPDHRLEFHRKLPTGGRHKMINALLRDGMIAETRGDYRLGEGCTLVEDTATGLMLTTLALTDAGMAAIGHEVPTVEATAPNAAAPAAASSFRADDHSAGQHQCWPPPACTGGHATDPNEQNTQQSPGFGRSTALQPLHS
jgi:hypothetical protein